MPQVPTARGIKIRSASDAHLLFYAVHLQRLPIIQRRLDATERLEVTSGAVFVWEERSASASTGTKLEANDGPAAGVTSGIERWTDGLKWGPSRVRDDFLFYQEKDPSADPILSPPALSHAHPYRKGHIKQPELLIKQTYSVHYNPQVLEGRPPVEPARKWHLTAYQSAGSADRLAEVSSVPELQDITPPEGLFRKARIGKKREGPTAAQPGAGAAAPGASIYPLEPYSSGHTGMSGIGHGHGHRNGGHSASGSFDGRLEHGREGSMASGSWREDSNGEMGGPHRSLPPQHPPQGLGQDGYPTRSSLPPSSGYPPSHNGHVPTSNGYHGAPYTPQSHYTPSHGHSASHHSHSGSMSYGEPESPYAQTHPNPSQVHGGGYGGGISSGYSYPQREISYGHPAGEEYGRAPGTQESPSMSHTASVMGTSLPTQIQHNQPIHHPHSNTNRHTTYDSYHPPNHTSQQQQTMNSSPRHQNVRPIQPPQDALGQVQQIHHSYSYSNGHPLPEAPHSHQGPPHMQHIRVDSRSYPHTPQQRPIMPHPHSQTTNFDHRRAFSQSSHPVTGAMEGIRSPPVGVARIRKGPRKSEDITQFGPMMSRSPPANHVTNGTPRTNGSGVIGGNGGRSQFSPYSRPVDVPGPRQHNGIAPHHQNEPHSTLPSFEGPYNPRGTNGTFTSEDPMTSMHMRPLSAPHPFATPSVPSIPAPPDGHHYPPPVPQSLPPRTDMPHNATLSAAGGGYYFPSGPNRNGISANQAPSPFGQPDYSKTNPAGTWTSVSGPTPPAALRSTPLQTQSAYPFPAGSPPIPQHSAQPQHGTELSNGVVGTPAVPIGTTIPGHIVPHPNPNSSPLLTQFQPMSTSLGSNRSGSGSGGVGGGVNGSPELVGLHQHMAASAGGSAVGALDGNNAPARGTTPTPPRIDTSIGGVDSSPVSITAGGSVSGSASSKLGPLTPSTTLVTRDPEDERVLDLLSRGLLGAAGARGGTEGGTVVVAGAATDEEATAKSDE